MALKGQKLQTYSFELKKKAIELRMQGVPKKKVAEQLGIIDVDRLKVWMRRYKQFGDFGLVDTRGQRKQYVDQDRYVRRLELENAVLKKWLEITKKEVYRRSIESLNSYESSSLSPHFANKSESHEADITRSSNEKTSTKMPKPSS